MWHITNMSQAYVVFVTVGGRAEAEALARAVVEEKLAACVNLVAPVTSIYRWQGAVERAEEVLCVMKTTRARFARLKARVVELHAYEVPEVIALPVEAGHPPYLEWLAGSVKSGAAPGARTRAAASRRHAPSR
jgi:periplasmic divalent cation tolerance protein